MARAMKIIGCRIDGPRNNSGTLHSKPRVAWHSMQKQSVMLIGETAELEGAAEQPSGQNSGSRQIQPINRINTIEASSRTTRVYLQSHSHKQLLPTLGKCQRAVLTSAA